jgi:hypothetical protein
LQHQFPLDVSDVDKKLNHGWTRMHTDGAPGMTSVLLSSKICEGFEDFPMDDMDTMDDMDAGRESRVESRKSLLVAASRRQVHPYYYHPKSAKASQIFPAALGYQCESVFICGSVFLGCGCAAPGKSVCIRGSVSSSILLSSTADQRGESKSIGGRTVGIWTYTRRSGAPTRPRFSLRPSPGDGYALPIAAIVSRPEWSCTLLVRPKSRTRNHVAGVGG